MSRVWVGYLVVLAAALVLYVATCSPGVLWQDSGMFQTRVLHNDIEGKLGLALSHPLFYIIAIGTKYIPLGEVAYRINLVSAAAGALAIANLFLLLRLWLNESLSAVIAAATLALSHTFWRHATIPEPDNLYVALLLCELIMLLQYSRTSRVVYLYLLGLCNGLAIANHMFASMGLVCYVVFLGVLVAKRRVKASHVAAIVCFWLIGSASYSYLIIKNIVQTQDIAGTLASAVFGSGYRQNVLSTHLTAGIVKQNLLMFVLNFPTPNALLFFIGLYWLRRQSPTKAMAVVLSALLSLFFVFAFRYTVVDRYAFFIPFYCIACILIGIGAHRFIVQKNRKVAAILAGVLTLLPIPVYAVAPALARARDVNLGVKRQIPYRDAHSYFLQPWRTGYDGPERFAADAFATAAANAVIYADNNTVYPLLYAQEVKGQRPDVKIVSGHAASEDAPKFTEETIEMLLQQREVYVVSAISGYCPAFLLEGYDFERVGVLWRVVERHGEG